MLIVFQDNKKKTRAANVHVNIDDVAIGSQWLGFAEKEIKKLFISAEGASRKKDIEMDNANIFLSVTGDLGTIRIETIAIDLIRLTGVHYLVGTELLNYYYLNPRGTGGFPSVNKPKTATSGSDWWANQAGVDWLAQETDIKFVEKHDYVKQRIRILFDETPVSGETLIMYPYKPGRRKGILKDKRTNLTAKYDIGVFNIGGSDSAWMTGVNIFKVTAPFSPPATTSRYDIGTGVLEETFLISEHASVINGLEYNGVIVDDTYFYSFDETVINKYLWRSGHLLATLAYSSSTVWPNGADAIKGLNERRVNLRLCGDFLLLTRMRVGSLTESAPSGWYFGAMDWLPVYDWFILDRITLAIVAQSGSPSAEYGMALDTQISGLKKNTAGKVRYVAQIVREKIIDPSNISAAAQLKMEYHENTITFDGSTGWTVTAGVPMPWGQDYDFIGAPKAFYTALVRTAITDDDFYHYMHGAKG